MLAPAELKARAIKAIEERKKELISISQDVLRCPETGFNECRTANVVRDFFRRRGIPFEEGVAITGIRGVLGCGAPGPTVAVLGEMDALTVPDHPHADPHTGVAHACGHHCQVGILLGIVTGLLAPDVMSNLAGRVVSFAVPAEELIELAKRMELREQGRLEFLGGKQELIRLGALDDVDIAMMCHTATGGAQRPFSIGGTSNDNMIKLVRFQGRSAHAGRAPHLGINALNAATFAINAIHYNRETFLDKDTARSHGIITRGGDVPNAVPADVRLEWRVRGSTSEAVDRYSAIADRCFRAGALAVGAEVTIENIAGYLPMRSDSILQRLFVDNVTLLLGEGQVVVFPSGRNPGGSTDMGDVSHIMPVIHPYVAGTTGSNHARNYIVEDWELAVVTAAKVMTCVVIDLLGDGASAARKLLQRFKPAMTREQYLSLQRRRAGTIVFDGNSATEAQMS